MNTLPESVSGDSATNVPEAQWRRLFRLDCISLPVHIFAGALIALPLFWGGKGSAAREIVQFTIFVVAAVVLIGGRREKNRIPLSLGDGARRLAATVLGFMAVVALQIAPLPLWVVRSLSPQAAQIYGQVGAERAFLSLEPSTTMTALLWLAALFLAAVYLASLPYRAFTHPRELGKRSGVDAERAPLIQLAVERDAVVEYLEKTVIVAGAVCCVIALSHWALRLELLFGVFDPQRPLIDPSRAHWPFINPNHLAVLLEMALMLSAARLLRLVSLLGLKRSASRKTSWSELISRPQRVKRIVNYALLSLVMFVTVLFTASRAAVILVFLGLFILWFFYRAERRREIQAREVQLSRYYGPATYVIFAAVIAVVLLYAGEAGRELTAKRIEYGLTSESENIRWAMYGSSFAAWRDYLLTGVGLGCWDLAVQRYISPELIGFGLDYAHNDYLQLLTETGILGAGLLLFALATLFILWRRGRRASLLSTQSIELRGAGLALALPLIHAAVEFHFHIPAISLAFVGVLAIFLRLCELPQPTQVAGGGL